ncbi:MAG TPA: hypothetical protein PLZ57_01620 [Pseudobdellovibrionaceae bacterium]|nr:hypothetical protein [Pseudobdellovibrionaceae bacterium]
MSCRWPASLSFAPILVATLVTALVALSGCNVSQPQPNNSDSRVGEATAPCANFPLGLFADPQGEVQVSLRRSADQRQALQVLLAEIGQELSVDVGPQSFTDTLSGQPQLQAQARCEGRALRIQGHRLARPGTGPSAPQNFDYTLELSGQDLALTALVGSRLRANLLRLIPPGGTNVADLHVLLASAHRPDRCPSFARQALTFVGSSSTGRTLQISLHTPARKTPTLRIGADTLSLDGIARTQQGVTRLGLCDSQGEIAFIQLGRVAEPSSAKLQATATHLRGQLRIKSSRWTTEESFLLAPQ